MCTYEYLTQSAKATCTPVAPPDLCLELICQVNGSNNNFTIQWHYSSSSSPSSQDSISSVENVIGNDSETVLEIRQSKLSSSGVISTLVLKYDIQAAGYYWCTVMNASYPTPNPSQVLNISTSLFNGDATTSLNLVKCNGSKSLFDTPRTIRCANHNMSIDAQLGSCATAIVTFPDLESTILPSSVLIVGIAFALLIAIIIIVLIAIVYLNHKKKKIKGTKRKSRI